MTAEIFDFEKVKKEKQKIEDSFTFGGYVQDLRTIQALWPNIEYSQQEQIFIETSNLLIALIESALSKGLED